MPLEICRICVCGKRGLNLQVEDGGQFQGKKQERDHFTDVSSKLQDYFVFSFLEVGWGVDGWEVRGGGSGGDTVTLCNFVSSRCSFLFKFF